MKRRYVALWVGCLAMIALLGYGGVYLHYRNGLALVHRVTWGITSHSIELNGDRGPAMFWNAMASQDPEWQERIEREERGWQRLAAFFLPLRWLECRYWDLFYRHPIP